MTAQPTRWFAYDEPTAADRVEAAIRTTYDTGPNESREDDVRCGTVAIEALDMIDSSDAIQYHTHDDGSVLLSGLSPNVEERFLASFEEEGEGEETDR
jgi:hypothetical protein